MTCHELRRVGDSYLSGQLPAETNRHIRWHLETCSSCRKDLDERRRIHMALRGAFERAPELQPGVEFSARLRNHLRADAQRSRVRRIASRSWLALAAGLVLAIGLTGAFVLHRARASADALAQDAIGDHRNCALKYRLARMPVSLAEAADRFDRDYRLLIDAPRDEVSTPDGSIRVLERHSCVYQARRFGHVVMQYHDHVVSLLMTQDRREAGMLVPVDAFPRRIGQSDSGLTVVSVNGGGHAILLVSDLASAELTQLSTVIAMPLARQLRGSVLPANPDTVVAVESALTSVFACRVAGESK